MKNLLFSCCIFLLPAIGFSQVSFGAGGTYLDDFGLQVRAFVDLNDEFMLSPQFSYYFIEQGSAFSIDANVSYQVAEINENSPVYVLGGLDLTHTSNDGFSNSELGINIGAGLTVSSFYAELFYRKFFCDGCDGDIGINFGYRF